MSAEGGALKPLTNRTLAALAAVLAALIEGITCLLRFGLGLESTRDTASTVGRLTFGIRIHHGYVGLLIVVAAVIVMRRRPGWSAWARLAIAVGIALVASDLIHHFLVLWPVTGSPQFHLVYPR